MGLLLSLPPLSHPTSHIVPQGFTGLPWRDLGKALTLPSLLRSPSIKEKLLAQPSLCPKQPQGGGCCLREVVSSLSQGWMSNLSHFSAAARRGCTE